ncbi:MAG: DUF5615 family PIN-like protein [Dysgonamonadaceae bacterium]|jgi:predicted nuclease of predicted toxin-antitoxin system|nr:DUF5615 family PIN-like protein [Dysgonamonadaceae bacterium]
MELRFLVDTQLPPSLAEFLKRRGFDATHVIDHPKGALTSDKEIIAIAKNELRIIITKDSELFALLKRFIEQITSFYATEDTKFLIMQKDKIIFF